MGPYGAVANCVGAYNYKFFLLFLFYTFLATIFDSIVLLSNFVDFFKDLEASREAAASAASPGDAAGEAAGAASQGTGLAAGAYTRPLVSST
jgi:hypothetical protein